MKHAWVGCGLIVLLLLGSWQSAAALRCEHRIVSSGDSPAEVLFKCGPPTVQQQRDEEIEVFDSVFLHGRRSLVSRRMIVPVEIWTYNFGPHALLYELIFRHDRVVHIRTRGYGF